MPDRRLARGCTPICVPRCIEPSSTNASPPATRAFLRFLLHHDYLQARREILFNQVPILRDNPDCPAWTMFDYRHGRVEIGTHLTDLEGENAPEWLDRVARTVESGGRMQLHVMLLRDGELTKF
ncbi:hypothetical protein B0H14DRAFT_3854379 [Mycena olivaceomarginata]|nr:hypothetical protein B0H14DRAFT_3854379 [Mycena olivaceomarginata]